MQYFKLSILVFLPFLEFVIMRISLSSLGLEVNAAGYLTLLANLFIVHVWIYNKFDNNK